MEKTEVKAAMVERYPDPNIEDPQLVFHFVFDH